MADSSSQTTLKNPQTASGGNMVRIHTVRPLQLTLEDVLCSKVRLRILKLLTQSRKLTTSEIAAKVGVNYIVARGHLEALEKGNVLTHANFGKRIRYYGFEQSAKANAVRNFIEVWGRQETVLEKDSWVK
jgi:predicted transcriptional regulator